MYIEYIDGIKLKEMFLAAAHFLEDNKQAINAVNVFPVPDGDTGTNMSLTMMAAVKEIQGMNNSAVAPVAEAVAKGALKGARGNSGVILSQLLRGFSKGLQNIERMNTRQCALALQEGSKTAYKAVMKPVEGTMLTVARVTGEKASKIAKNHSDFGSYSQEIIKVAKDILEKTPDMLPQLKEAGVVDSGGLGVLYIFMGAVQALKDTFDPGSISIIQEESIGISPEMVIETDIKYGYCTEFFIKNLFPYVEEGDTEKLKSKLENLGDSIVVVGDTDLIKVHVHTNMPGKALQLALRFGELSDIKIDNMREQHRHIVQIDKKEFGVVAVAMGEGISAIFRDLSVDRVIEGGQTMNPSIEDILKAVEDTNAENVFVLPNNSNIILSAKQAQDISETNIITIPSKSIAHGLAAILAFNPDSDLDTNIASMEGAMEKVQSGQVTYAVRDSEYNGIEIKKGDIIGLADGKIVVSDKQIDNTTKALLDKMINDDSEIATILYGQDVEPEDTQGLEDYLAERYPDLDVEIHSGGQPLYYYIISVE